MLAETVTAAARIEIAEGVEMAKKQIWLPFVDAYRTKCIVPIPSFRLRLEQITKLELAA